MLSRMVTIILPLFSIVETPWTPWDRWNYRSQQRSPVLNLTAGEPLLLLADNTETSGSDYLQVHTDTDQCSKTCTRVWNAYLEWVS